MEGFPVCFTGRDHIVWKLYWVVKCFTCTSNRSDIFLMQKQCDIVTPVSRVKMIMKCVSHVNMIIVE